jgi:hypothetical protein
MAKYLINALKNDRKKFCQYCLALSTTSQLIKKFLGTVCHRWMQSTAKSGSLNCQH